MAVYSVLIALQASRKDGKSVTSEEFLVPLEIGPDEVESKFADRGEWASGSVRFAIVRQSEYLHVDTTLDAGAITEAFEGGIAAAFQSAAQFFDRRQPKTFGKMRKNGLSLRIFVDVRMDQDQMELDLPSDFLKACGRHSLGVYLISNDISAAEILESREKK